MLSDDTTLQARLLDSLFTLGQLETRELELAEKGQEMSTEQCEALDAAAQDFEAAISLCLETQRSSVLEDALETLYLRQFFDSADILHAEIRAQADSVWDPEEGTLYQAMLLPVVMSQDFATENVPPDFCHSLAQQIATAYKGRFLKVVVSGVLRSPHEIYNLKFHEIQALHTSPPHAIRRLLTDNLTLTSAKESCPTLRFILVQTSTAPSDDVLAVLGESLSPQETQSLTTSLAKSLATVFGAPLAVGHLARIWGARSDGMLSYVHSHSRESVLRQVNASGQAPASMIMTLHCDVEADIETEGVANLGQEEVTQVRVSVLDAEGKLIAGHIFELNAWLSLEQAKEVVFWLGSLLGLTALNQLATTLEREPKGHAPYFLTGKDWVRPSATSLRLTQETF